MITAMGTDIGRVREINEDAFSVRRINKDCSLMIVADGMGGHNAGETASNTACNIITERICSDLADVDFSMDKVFAVMKDSIAAANKSIYSSQLADSSLSGMGTTVVVASCLGKYLQIANVGDSRLYVIGE